MNREKEILLVGLVTALFITFMAILSVYQDREELRMKLEAGLVQKIEGGTVIWTKP